MIAYYSRCMTTADFLRSIDMFSELDDELLEPIVDQSETLDLQRGETKRHLSEGKAY